MDKKIKTTVASVLFMLCMGGALYSVNNILDYRDVFLKELFIEDTTDYTQIFTFNITGYEDTNINNINKEEDKIKMVEFPLWYKAIWEVVNLIFYLFVGGLLYAKNNAFEN